MALPIISQKGPHPFPSFPYVSLSISFQCFYLLFLLTFKFPFLKSTILNLFWKKIQNPFMKSMMFNVFFGNKTIKPNNTYLFMHDLQGFTCFVFLHWNTYCWIHDDLQSLTNLFGVTLKEFGVHWHSHKGVSALILPRWIYVLPYYDDNMCWAGTQRTGLRRAYGTRSWTGWD